MPHLLLVPAVAVLAVLTGYPLVRLLVMSTQEFGRAQVFGKPPEFVGLDNYTAVLSDRQFWLVLARSIAFCAVNVVLTMALGLLVALLLLRLGRVMRAVVSVGLLLAWAMPALTAIVIWGWMFDTQYGIVNWLLTAAGMDMTGHSWLIQPLSFFAVATVVITWQAVPFVAFTLYAALSQVPEELMEAAELDGATAAQRFRHITYALLRPVVLILTMLEVIWDLRVFTQIFALQDSGGITAETSTIGVYIYQVGVAQGRFDTGSAIAVILVVIMLAASFVYVRQVVREEAL
ncbi:carbohydrate ABC transporter permease [Angustibacter sp. Root456]|uniref:carbohydrate ABC transporter permease n=1 Tax=Angustibacter sp. Root456 TaxID=1736539 RepID=UPI001910C6C3|nr:sugar ABC transporter permease [Angustibacter sp. Root456]